MAGERTADAVEDDVVTGWFRALNLRSVEALCELAHPEIELVPTDYTAPPGTAYHGHAGLRTFARSMWERYPDLRIEELAERQLENSRLALCRMIRTDPGDGGPEIVPRALLFELEAGLVRRLRVYHTEAEALEAAARSVKGGFRAVFDNADDAILLLDRRGRLVDVNRSGESLIEVDREARLGKGLVDFVGGDRAPWDLGWRTLRESGHATGTLEVMTSGGRRVSVRFWATADFIPGQHLLLLRESHEEGASGPMLTPREREILGLLAAGLTARQIAHRLVVSPATVRTHVQNAVSKLEAATRVQAIAIAITRGEIESPAR